MEDDDTLDKVKDKLVYSVDDKTEFKFQKFWTSLPEDKLIYIMMFNRWG